MIGKRIMFAVWIVILIVLVSGCKDDETELAHVFDETMLKPSEHHILYDLSQNNKGDVLVSYSDVHDETLKKRLGITDASLEHIVPLHNDIAQIKQMGDVVNDWHGEKHWVVDDFQMVYAMDDDQGIYVLQKEVARNDQQHFTQLGYAVFQYDAEGHLLKQTLLESSEQLPNFLPLTLLLNDTGFILFSYDGVIVYDAEGKIVDEIVITLQKGLDSVRNREVIVPSGNIRDIALDIEKQTIVFLHTVAGDFRTHLSAYSLQEKRNVWSKQLPQDYLPRRIKWAKESRSYDLISDNEMTKYDQNGNEVEEFVSLTSSFSSELTQTPFIFLEMIRISDKQFYIYRFNKEPGKGLEQAVRFDELSGQAKKDKIAQKNKERAAKTKVAVYVPYLDSWLEKQVALFEQQYPDIAIELTYFRKNMDEFNELDYKQQINLNIMTNQHKWDLLDLKHLPVKQYQQKNIFANLDEIDLQPWTDLKARLFPNLLQAANWNGQLTVLPTRILFPVNYADKIVEGEPLADLHTWEQLFALAANLVEKDPALKPWLFGPKEHYLSFAFSMLMNNYQMELLELSDDSDGQKNAIKQFLNLLKHFADHPEEQGKPVEDSSLFNITYLMEKDFTIHLPFLSAEKTILSPPVASSAKRQSFLSISIYSIDLGRKIRMTIHSEQHINQ